MPEYTDCDNKNIPFDVLIRSLITTDDNGDAAIRVTNNLDTEVPFVDCQNKNISFEQAIRKAIVDVNGKPALNLASI